MVRLALRVSHRTTISSRRQMAIHSVPIRGCEAQ